MIYQDRIEAGKRLAEKLGAYANRSDVLVLALPRGGVPVAFEVAQALRAPLDIFLVRKLGVPGHEELAMGAIATGGVRVLSEDVMRYISIPMRRLMQLRRKSSASWDGATTLLRFRFAMLPELVDGIVSQ